MPAEDDYARFSDLADELGLEDQERENYIGQHMSKKGYRPVTSWTDPEPEDGGNDSGFSPFKGQSGKRTRPVQQRKQGDQQRSSNWQYRDSG